jgi:hypothetical protein
MPIFGRISHFPAIIFPYIVELICMAQVQSPLSTISFCLLIKRTSKAYLILLKINLDVPNSNKKIKIQNFLNFNKIE